MNRKVRFPNAPDVDIEPVWYVCRQCPVCYSDEKTQLGIRKVESPTTKGWYTFQHYDVKCDVCGFHFSTNIPNPDYINDYYKYAVAHAGLDYDVPSRIKVIERLVPAGLCILEYGAAQNEFVEVLCEHGYEASGVDVGDTVQGNDYDVICCYYTLEHLIFPNDVLRTFRELLVEKGILIVEVPDYEKDKNAAMHFQHFNHFTESHLTQMLENNGFKPVEVIRGHSRHFGIAIIAVS